MAKEILEFELKADTDKAKKDVKRFEDDIDGFRRRIQDKKAIKLSMNVAEIKGQIDAIKKKLKEVDDEKVKIELEADTIRLKQQLTQANRELRNYVRTGKKDVSVLGKLFQGVAGDIDKTRLELLKLGKSTKQLDQLEKDLNELNKDFRSWKINVQQYGSQLNKLQGNIKNTGGAFWSLKKTLKWVAGFFIAGLGIQQLISFTKQSVEEFVKFEKGLARINTVANVTKERMEGLGVEIKNISATFWIAKDELLETGFNISSAGVEFENVSKIMRLSAITAVGAGTDTTTAFNGIIAVIKKYGENINIAGDIAEKFFIANKLGQTTIWDMATALQNLTSSAKPAGVSINEVFAILSTLTGVTGDANKVITQLNGAINALASPTTEASAKFKELGIEVGQSAIEEKGFVTVAKEVYDAVWGNLEQLRKLIPEVEAQKLIVALATTQNVKYKKSLDEVTTGQGNLEEAVRKMADTSDFKLKVAGRKWDNFKTKTGQVLIKTGAFLLDFWSVVISVFKIFWSVLKQWVNAILWLTDVTFSSLADIVYNWKEFARVIPEYVKEALNNLPGIMSAGIRAMLGAIPGGIGDTIADKLGLDTFGNIFKDVETDFNFRNTKRAFDNLTDNAIKNNQEIAKEWKNITSIVTWKSKEQQLAIAETIEEIENLNQSFGDDTIDKLDKKLNDLNKKLRETKIGTEEYKKLQAQIKEVKATLGEATKGQDDFTSSVWGTTKKVDEEAKALEKTKKNIETLGKTNEKVYGEIIKDIENGVDGLEKYIEGIEKANDKIKDFRDDAVSNIRDINNELAGIDLKGQEELWNRFVKILEEQKDLEKDIKEEGDYAKKKKLQEELNELERERKIILENTTEEQRKQAEELAKLTEAEKTIQDIAKQKEVLEERKKIYEAIKNGEEINLDEIQDYKNLKLAEDLTAKQNALNLELKTLTDNLELQRQALLNITEEKKKFEKEWTEFFWTEIQKQKNFAKELQVELKRVIALQKQAGISGVSLWTTGLDKDTNGDTQTIDNSRKVDININATSNIDIDYAVEKISETVK